MFKIIIAVIFSVMLNAYTVNDIVSKIPKNSQEYTLDITLAQKIKGMKFSPPQIQTDVNMQYDYVKSFFNLVLLKQTYEQLPEKLTEIQNKLNLLKNAQTPTEKLEYLYYKKLFSIANERFSYLNKNFSRIEKSLYKKIKNIKFDVNLAKDNLKYWQNLLSDKKKEFEKLNIDLQKWKLLNNKENILKINSYIKINLAKQKDIYRHIFKNELVLWLNYIKNKDKQSFKTENKLLSYASHLYNKQYKFALNQILNDYEKFTFGSKVLVYSAKKELEITFEKLLSYAKYPLFTVGNRIITPLNFALFILILIIGWFIGKYYKYFIYKLRHSKNISYSTATLLANMGYYAILTVSFLIALKVVGLDLSSLAIIAGALSVGIGFGLQNIVSNFVSGIILMFERSIKVGDYIQIDENTRGEVVDISMRSTVIRTNDNINLIIPNQSFIQNNVINWTLGDDTVRFRIPFGVAYGTDIDEMQKVIFNAIEKSNLHYIKTKDEDYKPRITFMSLGDSSLNFELFIWVKGEYSRRPRRAKSEFLKVIYNALNKAGIGIPFPQQDLHIKDSVPFEIKIKKD